MTITRVSPAVKKPEEAFSLSIDAFPAHLQPLLQEIDDEGNGQLELDELTEVFTLYADMKKASKEGNIALSTLPKELQPTLKVFDVDGDGTVGTVELARAADLYKDSKNLTKRLTKAVAVLLFIMLALVGTIVGLTAHVIEQAKDSKPGANGVMMSTGASPAPVATGQSVEDHTLFSLLDASVQTIANIIDLKFVTDQNSVLLYTITGSHVRGDGAGITFYAARGDVIELTPSAVTVTSAANEILINKTRQAFENENGRKLLAMPNKLCRPKFCKFGKFTSASSRSVGLQPPPPATMGTGGVW